MFPAYGTSIEFCSDALFRICGLRIRHSAAESVVCHSRTRLSFNITVLSCLLVDWFVWSGPVARPFFDIPHVYHTFYVGQELFLDLFIICPLRGRPVR